jgi:hypothetical protein
MLKVQGVIIFSDGSRALSPSWHASVDASSSNICDNDWEKCGDERSISKRNAAVFILVLALE